MDNESNTIINAKNGDKQAMAALLLDNKGIVAGVVSRLIWEKDPQKDIIQTIFSKVIQNISSFNSACRFSTWVYRIAMNECVEFIRKKARTKDVSLNQFHDEDPFTDTATPDGITNLSNKELREDIKQSLHTLPLDQKTAFSLFYFGSYSGREGAKAMNISEANFFMKLKTGRDKVKNELMKRGWTV